jgi:hypothetical protein
MGKNVERRRGLVKLFSIVFSVAFISLLLWILNQYTDLFKSFQTGVQSGEHDELNATLRDQRPMFQPTKDYFRIVILSDLHFGEEPYTPWGPIQDFKSRRAMGKILDTESPDLVVLLGDLLTGEFMK